MMKLQDRVQLHTFLSLCMLCLTHLWPEPQFLPGAGGASLQ